MRAARADVSARCTVPRRRHMHTVPTPRIGGIAVYLGFAVALLRCSASRFRPRIRCSRRSSTRRSRTATTCSPIIRCRASARGLLFGSLLISASGSGTISWGCGRATSSSRRSSSPGSRCSTVSSSRASTNPFDHNPRQLDRLLRPWNRRSADAALVRRDDERDQLHRRPRRPALRLHRDLGPLHVRDIRCPRPTRAGDGVAVLGRRRARLSAVQLQPGDASSSATRGRSSSATYSRRSRSSARARRRLRSALHRPAGRPRAARCSTQPR